MKSKPQKNGAARDGQLIGATLADGAAQFLLQKYSDRRVTRLSPASERWVSAQQALEHALGPTAAAPDIAAMLKELDDAHGDALVETEDRAWHAAWTLAMKLTTGSSNT